MRTKPHNKVFGGLGYYTAQAGINLAFTWRLNNNNREFLVRSIGFDASIVENAVGGETIGFEANRPVNFIMGVAESGSANNLGSFQNLTMGGVPVAVNNLFTPGFVINKPGQYFFDSWYIREFLPFTLTITNNDPVNSYNVRFSVFVEVEDIFTI